MINGGPDLGSGAFPERVRRFRSEYDFFRSAVVNEPRGSDVVVGALLCEPVDRTCTAGAIFFNNVAYLGMCGHGTIGLIVSLAHAGRVHPGEHRVETPVDVVTAMLHESGEVTVNNVSSYRKAARVAVEVPSIGTVYGDIAWGGNWFFLVAEQGLELTLNNVDVLTGLAWTVRQVLKSSGITGDGEEIDHVELLGPSSIPGVNSKNFVLCPGKAYDRSPCGTGTSTKLAPARNAVLNFRIVHPVA